MRWWSAPLGALAIVMAVPALGLTTEIAGQPLTLTFSETADLAYHLDQGVVAPGPETPCHQGLPGFLSRPVRATPSAEYDPTGDCYADWLNRFDVQASWGRWHAELRFDSALFGNAPSVSNQNASAENLHLATLLENRYTNNLIVEKISASYLGDRLDLTLGDFYIAYGRGLVLSLTKIDALGVDTTLRGASVTGHFGGFSANVAAGVTNVVNTDESTGEVAPDPMDRIVAGRLEYRWPRVLTIGVDGAGIYQNPATAALSSYTPGQPVVQLPLAPLALGSVTSQPPQAIPGGLWNTDNGSVTLELPRLGDVGKLYLEYAHQVQWVGNELRPEGNAFYGSLSLFFGPATLLIEGKDYQNFSSPLPPSLSSQMFPAFWQQNVYTNAPTLEESFQEEYYPVYSIAGPRLRVDVAVTDWLTPYASAAYFADDTNGYDIADGFLGLDAHWQERRSHASLAAGRRIATFNGVSPTPGAAFQHEWWVQYDLVQVLGPVYSLELEGLHRRWDEDFFTGHPWTWSYGYLSLRRHEWSLTLGDEYYSQFPSFDRVENPNIGGSYSPTDRWTFRLFAGGRTAGLRCVNGICRNYPGFEGASVEVTARF